MILNRFHYLFATSSARAPSVKPGFYSLKYNGENLQVLPVLNYVLLLLDFL